MSQEHILRSVIATLRSEVLPQLDATSVAASNVRASLMMLVNLERRVELEPGFLRDDNQALRDLLQTAGKHADEWRLDASLRADIEAGLRDAEAPASLNQRLQELLTRLITQLGATPRATSPATAQFKRQLHRYLAESSERNFKLVEAALREAPV